MKANGNYQTGIAHALLGPQLKPRGAEAKAHATVLPCCP